MFATLTIAYSKNASKDGCADPGEIGRLRPQEVATNPGSSPQRYSGFSAASERSHVFFRFDVARRLPMSRDSSIDTKDLDSAGLLIRLESLEMSYGEGEARVHAIRKLSLEIPRGQFVVVRGRSGSGKTTLFHLIAGMKQPTLGRVFVGETEMSRLNEAESARFRRRHIGLVYQFFNLVPILDVVENIALPLLLDGKRLTDSLPRVEALMRRLGIAERAGHLASKLSGGEMQRVAIARALVGDPGLVLADEPTGNLDDRNADEVLNLLTELCRERGITIVIMTHDASATERADRVLTLRDGEVQQDLCVREPRPV